MLWRGDVETLRPILEWLRGVIGSVMPMDREGLGNIVGARGHDPMPWYGYAFYGAIIVGVVVVSVVAHKRERPHC